MDQTGNEQALVILKKLIATLEDLCERLAKALEDIKAYQVKMADAEKAHLANIAYLKAKLEEATTEADIKEIQRRIDSVENDWEALKKDFEDTIASLEARYDEICKEIEAAVAEAEQQL